jgi:hypothetical protein
MMSVTQLDARGLDLQDLFKQLKEILAMNRGSEVCLEVLLDIHADAAKVKSFVSMSGCMARVEKKGEYYVVHIYGTPCCV